MATSQINPANDRGSVYDNTVSVPEVKLTGLAPATRYYYYVRPICPGGIAGIWSNTKYFDSECLEDGVALPLMENFDDFVVESGDKILPVCWSVKTPVGITGGEPCIATSGKSSSLFNYLACDSKGSTLLITPEIGADIKDCQVRFAYYIKKKEIPMEVGVMTDPTDENTFVKVAEFTSEEVSWSFVDILWTEEQVTFDSYDGDGRYIAFRFPTANVKYHLDDIIVEDKAACGEPTNLRSTASTSSTITLDWTPSDGGEISWDIAYAKQGVKFSSTEKKQGVTRPYTIEGLDENFMYDVYIRSACTAGGKGSWIGPVQAKTNAPATLPYTCDFEDETKAGAWNLYNGIQENQWVVGDAVETENDNAGRALYISTDYGVTAGANAKATYSYAARTLEIGAGLVDFEFDWRLSAAGKHYMLLFLVPADLPIAGGVYSDFIYQINPSNPYARLPWSQFDSKGWICLKDSVIVADDQDWHHYKATYPVREAGRYNIVILYRNGGSAKGASAAVDKVSVKANTTDILSPVDLVAYDIKQYEAKVKFVNYNAQAWKVIVSDSAYSAADLETATKESRRVAFFNDNSIAPAHIRRT